MSKEAVPRPRCPGSGQMLEQGGVWPGKRVQCAECGFPVTVRVVRRARFIFVLSDHLYVSDQADNLAAWLRGAGEWGTE